MYSIEERMKSYEVKVKGNVLALVTVSVEMKDGRSHKKGDYIARFRAEAEAIKHENGEYINHYWNDESIIEINEETIEPEDCTKFTIIYCDREYENDRNEYISCVKQVFDEELNELI